MILIFIGAFTLAMTALVYAWAALEIRRNRWRLYALRDELRRMAIVDRAFGETDAFLETDWVLSKLCHCVDTVSTRALLDATLATSKDEKMPPEDNRVLQIQLSAGRIMFYILACRWIGILIPLGATVVGGIAAVVFLRRQARAIWPALRRISGEPTPPGRLATVLQLHPAVGR